MSAVDAFEVPDELVAAIAEGRCVAFLGAGVSQPDAPSWARLLADLAAHLPAQDRIDVLSMLVPASGHAPHAAELEAAAQMLRDALGAGFERAVHEHLSVVHDKTADRYRLLGEIPFEAVLTTNQDSLLAGRAADDGYAEVLRGTARRGRHWQFAPSDSRRQQCVIKLHGDVSNAATNPLVFARADYRARLYRDGRYANFLRSVFATRTVLFLGVSFTDAYLNELRSEVVALLATRGARAGEGPIAYAVMPDRSPAWCAYMRRHDRVEILPYTSADDGKDHRGFDRWLAAIHARTAAAPRLARVLHDRARAQGIDARIVWIDRHPSNNDREDVQRLRAGGVEIEQLTDPLQLDERARTAALVITSYDRGVDPTVFDAVMTRMQPWTSRPPVIVFTAKDGLADKRAHALRRGAFECCASWNDLFDAVERLFAVNR